ncbi:MAG: hypothetical protein LBO21_10020 [Synergistaceae bacterium]|jgi:hypothetical protein|nr:hypothetical protein [Synergistaceae bacterium]
MRNRILSSEENDSLSPEAIKLAYKHLCGQYCAPGILEKVLLQAVLVARINQCKVDGDMFEFLIEKISEYEGVPVFGPADEDGRDACRYC